MVKVHQHALDRLATEWQVYRTSSIQIELVVHASGGVLLGLPAIVCSNL